MGKSKLNVPVAFSGGMTSGLKPPAASLAPKPAPQPAGKKQMELATHQGSASEYAKMMADPLNAPVVGRPDSNSMATNVCRIRDVYDIVSNATGYAAAGVAPHTNGGYTQPVLTGANAVFSAGATFNASQYSAQLITDNNSVRVLAVVVEWVPTESDNIMAGRVFLGQYCVTDGSLLPDGAISTYFDDEGQFSSAKVNATTIARPWKDNDFLNPTGGQENFPSVLFAGMGFPFSKTVGQLAVTRIIELLPKGTVLARHQATHTICDPMACCQAQNIVGRGVMYASGDNASSKLASNGLKLLAVISRTVKAFNSGGVSEIVRML